MQACGVKKPEIFKDVLCRAYGHPKNPQCQIDGALDVVCNQIQTSPVYFIGTTARLIDFMQRENNLMEQHAMLTKIG